MVANQKGTDLFDQLFTTPFMPFTVAVLVMFGIGIIEAVGLGLSAFDLHLHIDHDADGDGLLSWLGIGEVPLLMILISFLALFGISGLMIQNTAKEMLEAPLSLVYAVPLALLITLPLLGITARVLARIMPKDETTAISLEDLRGKRATILLGSATPGSPTRARITDFHGQAHYLLVEPDTGTVSEGDELILVRREGDVFVGTAPYSTDFQPTI
jgi:hypothetical protein